MYVFLCGFLYFLHKSSKLNYCAVQVPDCCLILMLSNHQTCNPLHRCSLSLSLNGLPFQVLLPLDFLCQDMDQTINTPYQVIYKHRLNQLIIKFYWRLFQPCYQRAYFLICFFGSAFLLLACLACRTSCRGVFFAGIDSDLDTQVEFASFQKLGDPSTCLLYFFHINFYRGRPNISENQIWSQFVAFII